MKPAWRDTSKWASGNGRWLWPAAFLVLTLAGAVLLDGGYAHYEGQFFLVNYLDGRGPLEKIFSAHYNEWDCYQGRELSFLFGWLDAELIRYSARLGWVQLYSLTHFAGLFALAVTLWRALPRLFPELSPVHSGLLVALLLTTPTALFSGYYYRPAKILVALLLAVVLLFLAKVREAGWRMSFSSGAVLCIAGTLMGMSDRLGIYMLLLLIIVIAVSRPLDRAGVSIIVVLVVAIAVNGVWSATAGPRLSAIADGYVPDTIDQIVHLRFTYLRAEHYGPAMSLLADHVEYFFGNFGVVSLIAVALIAGLVTWRSRSNRVMLAFIVVVFATAALYVAMFARLTSLPWPASRRVYYWLPQLVVLAAGAAFIVGRSTSQSGSARRIATLMLLLMIGGNFLAIPAHRDAIRSQEHRPWIEQSAAVRECVRETRRPISAFALDASYAHLCGALRASVAGVKWDGFPAAEPNPKLYCRASGRPAGLRHVR